MRRARQKWTVREDRALFEMAAKGMTWEAIAEALGRGKDGCSSYYRDAVRRLGREKVRKQVIIRPRRCSPEEIASRLLFESVKEMFERTARETGISAEEVQRKILGGEPLSGIPGTETFLKTSAVRRLAA